MTEREKLIELIQKIDLRCRKYGCEDCDYHSDLMKGDKGFCLSERTADYLLSHGVTIPVRCAECKYYIPNGSFCVKTASWAYDSSAFCSYGERKDNG